VTAPKTEFVEQVIAGHAWIRVHGVPPRVRTPIPEAGPPGPRPPKHHATGRPDADANAATRAFGHLDPTAGYDQVMDRS